MYDRALGIVVTAALLASCRTAAVERSAPIVQPGAPGDPARVIGAAAASDLSQLRHTAADVRFMQGMIGHHAQAIEMAALVPARAVREDVRLLARRIDVSQADEIQLMQRWLTARGEALPDAHTHHTGAAPLMPGMLTPDEMRRLASATGAEFERLFLEGMIRHHDGALVMVAELFATPGAAQDSEIFAFASDVDADQRIEMLRMAAMLQELQK